MSKRMIEKTDGEGNIYLVPDPECYDHNGKFKKSRHTPTNFHPKKKKRK